MNDMPPAQPPESRTHAEAPTARRLAPRIVAALVLLAVLAAGAFAWWQPDRARALLGLAPRAAVAAPLVLQGNVDIREVDLGFRVGGRIAHLAVDEGDRVQAGQTLAELDTEPLRDALAAAQARRAEAAADLAKYVAGARTEDIAMARAALAEREATLENALLTRDRTRRLAATGAAPRQQADDAEAALRVAQAQSASARQALAQLEAGFRREDVDAARARDQEAAAQLADAERQLRDAVLTAPSAGIVRARVQEEGAIVAPGATVFTIALISPVWVRAYVPGIDLARARPGAAASIRTDDGRLWKGRVGYVSPTAEFTPKPVETPELRTSLVYRLRVMVDDPAGELRQGMPATVTLDAVP